MNKLSALAGVVALALAGSVSADTITYDNNGLDIDGTLNNSITTWADTSSLTQFDSTLFDLGGTATVTLNSVTTYFAVDWTGTWQGESTSAGTVSFGTAVFAGSDSVMVGAQVTSSAGGWSAGLATTDNIGGHTVTGSGTLTSVVTVAGAAGSLVEGVGNEYFILTSGDAGFADYIGTGTLDVDFSGFDSVTISQSGSGAQASEYLVDAGIFVVYDYTVVTPVPTTAPPTTTPPTGVPEPTGIALLGLGLVGLAFGRRKLK